MVQFSPNSHIAFLSLTLRPTYLPSPSFLAFWAVYIVILYYSYSCFPSIENIIIKIYIFVGLAIVVAVNTHTQPFITHQDVIHPHVRTALSKGF